MDKLPVVRLIEDLRAWLQLPPAVRGNAGGAHAMLDRIAGSHAQLLAACREALARWDAFYADEDCVNPLDYLDAGHFDVIRAAIAHATGEKP